MSDSPDDAQPGAGSVSEGGGGSTDIHSISISCAGCGDVYSVSDDDGLAGMSFPCDDCGTMVEVPELPWEGGPDRSEPAAPAFELPELPPEGVEVPPIEGGTSINISCFSCLEEYNVSADDGLSGMAFPCDNCGADVEVPEHPWPEAAPEQDYDDDFFNVGTKLTDEEQAERTVSGEGGGIELPPESGEVAAIEGGTTITTSCFSCLEEYNVSADDGLAGMAFPCDNCGADVEVPAHPWPDDAPLQDYDDDFFSVGTKLNEEELAEREEIRQAETEAAAEAHAENEAERERAAKVAEEAAAKAAVKAKEQAAEAKKAGAVEAPAPPSSPAAEKPSGGTLAAGVPVDPEDEASAAPVAAGGAEGEVAALKAPARAKGKKPKKPKWAKKKKAKKEKKAKGGKAEADSGAVADGDQASAPAEDDGATEQTARGRIIEIVERATGRRSGGGAEPAKRSLGVSGGGEGGGGPAAAGKTVIIEKHGQPGEAPARKRSSRPLPDRPREPMRGGISAPSGNYGAGGGGGGGPPDEIRMRIQRGGGAAGGVGGGAAGGGGVGADDFPPDEKTPGAERTSAGGRKAAPAAEQAPPEPLVIRIFGGVKKMFGGKSPQELISRHLGKPAAGGGGAAGGAGQEGGAAPARREVRIIQEAAGDVRKGIGVGAGEEVAEGAEEELDEVAAEELEEESRLKLQRTYVKIGMAAALVLAVLVGFREQLFGPLLGGAAPEGSGQFWEDRELDKSNEVAQPTVDLSEMMGAEAEADAFKSKSLSGETVDGLGYQNLKQEVIKLSKANDPGSKDLLLWALYRLATTFGDAEAKKTLLSQTPKRLNSENNSPMGLAAILGAMTLQGKGKQARRAAGKLTESEGSRSPQMLLVRSRTLRGRNAASKAVLLLSEAIEKQPAMIDAHILRAQQILDGSVDRQWVQGIQDCLGDSPDPDSVVRAAEVFIRGGEFGALGDTMKNFSSVDMAQHIADSRKERFLKLMSSRLLAEGDISAASTMAEERMDTIGDHGDRLVHAARYRQALGKDGVGLLDARLSGNISPGERAQLSGEKIRLLSQSGDVAGSEGLLQESLGDPLIKGNSWIAYAEGTVAESSGKIGPARKAYRRAARGKPRIPEADAARELAVPKKRPLKSGRLNQIVKRSGAPRARYELGKTLLAEGQAKKAKDEFERVLWTEPTSVNPVELVLDWLDARDRAGDSEGAGEVLEKIHSEFPEDPRPVTKLFEGAMRRKDAAGAQRWLGVQMQQAQGKTPTPAPEAAEGPSGGATGPVAEPPASETEPTPVKAEVERALEP